MTIKKATNLGSDPTNTITPGDAVTITATGEHAIVSYLLGNRATILVHPVVTAQPDKGKAHAGLTTTGGKLRTVALDQLTPIVDGWQLFEPAVTN